MRRNYFFSLLAIVVLTALSGVIAAQEEVTYEMYTSDDGRISFDVPEGWLVAPFGPAFNISTQGYVESADVEPGQQQIDIITLSTADLAAGGIDPELPLVDYAVAVLDTLDDGSVPDDFETRTLTLDSGIEAAVFDLTLGPARIFITVYQQDNVTIFVSSFAHESEFEVFEPIALHVINSIELGENADQAPTAAPVPTVSIVATDDEIQLPPVPEDGVPSGVYTFQFINNRAESPFSPDIARLNEGVTMDEFNEALATDDGLGAVLLVTLLGGTVVVPDEAISLTMELVPGDYMLMEFSEEGPGEMIPFVVVENETPQEFAAPVADVTLTMVDFAFGIPPILASGELLWHVENAGEQWHEAAIFSVPEGTTREDLLSSYESGEEADTEEFVQAFIWLPMSAGTESWTTISLEPGTYAIVCFLPDLAGDFAPHIAHGMVQVFTVE